MGSVVRVGFCLAVSVVGVVLPWPTAITALQRLGAGHIPFYADTAFCLLVGAGIWLLRKAPSKGCRIVVQ